MWVTVLHEAGYDIAAYGFSLSYHTSIERAEELLPKFAFGIPGEDKFLESISVWLDINAPRYWWQEFDTYRVGMTKQSESTIHTLMKRELTIEDFERPINTLQVDFLNHLIRWYKSNNDYESRCCIFQEIKNNLPEGFLQRREVCTNYKTLKNIYQQRKEHKLSQWRYFCNTLLQDLEYPEFIKQSPILKSIEEEDDNETGI